MCKIKIISVPFTLIGIPSLETASLKAFLLEKGIDVSIDNIYIKFADYLGGEEYKILRTTDVGEHIFSSLLFPELYEQNKRFSNRILAEFGLNFDCLYQSVFNFLNSYIASSNFDQNDIILFYMYTKQLLPALYFGKRIKEQFKCSIWFAGYNCKSEMGASLLSSFKFIDRVFAEEIEESVFYALSPNTEREINNNLDHLPTPDYSDFFAEVSKCSKQFQNERAALYYLQVELSRGCWWNKCSFCTLNCNTYSFREKSIQNIIRDYSALQKRYNTTQILISQYANNTNWRKILMSVTKEFPGLKYTYNFKVSALLDPDDFDLLKRTGTSILVGTESFSPDYLKLLNKGQTVIENIQVLKFAERKGVPCCHNLMYALPFEKEEFYEQSKETISFIYHLPPPFDAEEFRLTYDSVIYKNLQKFNVKSISFRKEKEADLFPENMKKTFIPFFYDFESDLENIEERKDKWNKLVKNWRDIYYSYAAQGRPKHLSLLYMNSNEHILQIYDMRYRKNQTMYTFSGQEREVYEFCDQIRSIQDILSSFPSLSCTQAEHILDYFVNLKLMFREENNYLSLAI